MSRGFQQAMAQAATLVSAATDRIAGWAAPAMPWLFIALRRAWVPSLVAVAAALMFFVVSQSREVLHGLSEPVLTSLADFRSEEQRGSINVLAWMSYVGSALVLGLSVWYSARLLATVGARRGTPNALESPQPGYERLLRATTWYPRWLGAGVLAAAVGALIYANYTPQLSDTTALLLAVLAIAGPWMLAVGWWQRSQAFDAPRWRWWMAAGALVGLGAAVWLVVAHRKWPVWAWSLACSPLPAVLWLQLANRRNQLQRRRHDTLSDAAASQTFGSVIITTVLLALGGIAVLLLLALLPPLPIRAFGSAATVLIFLAATCAFASAGQLWLRYVASDVPGLTTAATAVVALLVALVGQEGLGEESLPPPPATAAALAPAPAASSGTGAGAMPTVHVNAFGGGLRAAVFTALVLAQADDASCGEFGRRLAAASGVSGGSVGIATYLVARQELSAAAPWKACGAGADVQAPLTEVVTHALVQDHLSPVISRMLAVDAPHLHGLFGQPPTRGQALLGSWNGALIAGLAKRPDTADADRLAAFALPLALLHGGLNPAPAVYFNATDADSGHRVWFSNGAGGRVATHEGAGATGVSVGQAVLHSARFPIVSPAGALRAPWPHGALVPRLVDGGYADNSGATTLLAMAPQGVPLAVNINGNPAPVKACTKDQDRYPPIVTAVRGLLQARSAHADQAVARLKLAAGAGNSIDIGVDLARLYGAPGQAAPSCERIARANQPPLGWYMSYEAAMLLLHSSRVGAADLCQKLQLTCHRLPDLPPLPD